MNTTAGRPVIAVRDLVKSYSLRRSWLHRPTGPGSLRAVDGITFGIAPETTLGLVGESGCGKSTAAKLIMQLERPDSGEILLDGEPIENRQSQLRRSVQMVFQDPYASLTPHFRIESILREPLAVHKICARSEARGRIVAALEAVGLHSDIMRRYPHELSGGQRQRIGIARAIAIEPRLVICDEPVSALDISIRSQIVNLLLELQRDRGFAYLFISHDLDLVEHISDKIVVMYLGKIVEQAPAGVFFDGPKHPYSRGLLASSPLPDPRRRNRFTPMRGEITGTTGLPGGCRFRLRCPLAIDKCSRIEPPLCSVGADHFSACHRSEDLAQMDSGL